MPRSKQPSKVPLQDLTQAQRDDLERIEREAILNFVGSIEELERAIGMLRIGHHFGWKVLVLVHSKKTVAKYEEILGIKLREYFAAEGPSAQRSMAFKVASKLSNFWKAVSGETPVPDRQQLGRS
jgi:hypothetical protein